MKNEGVPRRRILRKLRLFEISAVDVPAQEPALIGLVKSAPDGAEEARRMDAETKAKIEAAIDEQRKAFDAERKAHEDALAAKDAELAAERKNAADREAELAAERVKRADEVLRSKAERELPHLPGTVEQKMAVLRAIDSIDAEGDREAAMRMLKSRVPALTAVKSVVEAGAEAAADGDGPITKEQAYAELMKMAAEHVKSHKAADGSALNKHKAFDEVCRTAAGAQLYHLYNTLPTANAAG